MSIKCPGCGKRHNWLYRFRFNYDNKVILACNNCGEELIDRDKVLFHLIISGIIFGALLWVEFKSFVIDAILTIGTPYGYFVAFIPFRK
ncbi:MAG: hypothetical protein P8X89_24210 [Reinekea sp.]